MGEDIPRLKVDALLLSKPGLAVLANSPAAFQLQGQAPLRIEIHSQESDFGFIHLFIWCEGVWAVLRTYSRPCAQRSFLVVPVRVLGTEPEVDSMQGKCPFHCTLSPT